MDKALEIQEKYTEAGLTVKLESAWDYFSSYKFSQLDPHAREQLASKGWGIEESESK